MFDNLFSRSFHVKAPHMNRIRHMQYMYVGSQGVGEFIRYRVGVSDPPQMIGSDCVGRVPAPPETVAASSSVTA